MNKITKFLLTAALGAACAVQAQSTTWETYVLTNLPTAIASTGVSNITSLRLANNTLLGAAFLPSFTTTSAVSGTVTYVGEVTPFPVWSAAVATTTSPWSYTVAANGTNAVRGLKVLLPSATPGYLWLTKISNGTDGTIFPSGQTNYWVRGKN